MRLLYDHGYLDRPLAQLEHFTAGSRMMVYGMGSRRMEARRGTSPRSLKRPFIQHTLAVAEILVRLESACKGDLTVEFVGMEEALEQIKTDGTSGRKLNWNVSTLFKGTETNLGVVPDHLFGLRPRTANGAAVFYFLEVDRGTMPVMRSNLHMSSVYRKLLAYHETWRQGLHISLFDLKRLQVLMVTNGEDRLRHLIAATKTLANGRGSRIFLFADMQYIKSTSNIFAVPLTNGCEELSHLKDA